MRPDRVAGWERTVLRGVAPPVFLALLLLCLLAAGGCGIGNRFLFSAAGDVSATPQDHGLVYEDFWFPARDGTRLNGWMISGRQDLPLVLYFHGNNGNLSDCLEYLSLLNSLGFPLCIFDYRGYGKSDGFMDREKDLYDDARGALDHLTTLGWKPERMIFFGQSLGAAIALQMALETVPAGLVLESPFTSLKAVQQHLSIVGYTIFGRWGFTARFDNLSKIPQARMPLLFISGDQDRLTPLDMTLQLHRAAKAPTMLHVVRGGDHCDVMKSGKEGFLQAWRLYLRFMKWDPGTRERQD